MAVYLCLTLLFSGIMSGSMGDRIVRFHDNWKFHGSNAGGAEDPSYNDNTWETVFLPHPMSLEAPGGRCPTGDIWYRKIFSAETYQGKKVIIEFQGAMQTTDVYVNGTRVTTHLGGYDPFAIDITGELQFDGDNVIAVKLNNSPSENFPPAKSTPDFRYWGGLYRDVRLHVTDPLHISHPLVADIPGGGGVFVTSPSVSRDRATVLVKTHVMNERTESVSCVLTTTLYDASGTNVATGSTPATDIGAGDAENFEQSLEVTGPSLWHPDHPSLYTVVSQVSSDDGTTPVDSLVTTIGIRSITFSKQGGFQINGDRMILRGGNRHQDYPYVGNAAPDRLQYGDALRLKEYGFNFVRMAHYIQSPAFVAGCDKVGVMSQMSLPGWQYSSSSSNFVQNSYRMIRAMIRYYRNSPSIIVWETAHNESSDSQGYSREAQEVAEEEFPGNQLYTVGEPSMSCYGDYGASYGYDVIATSTQHDGRACIAGTSKPMIFGEYGDWDFGGGRDRCGRDSESGMTKLARNHYWSLNANRAHSDLQADAVWTAIDYQSGGMTRSGAIDWARLPKFSAFFYQSQRDPSVILDNVDSGPMVYIMNWWTSSSPTNVRIFSNCAEVRLSLNGNVVATREPDTPDRDSSEYLEHRPYTFNVPFESGTLLAEGLIGRDVKATHSVSTPGRASEVRVLIDTENLPQLRADGSDMAFVYGFIVDDNGTLLQTETVSVTFTVSGPATLVTTETGSSVSVRAEAGVATALLRTDTTPGNVVVTASSGSLSEGSDTAVVGDPQTTETHIPAGQMKTSGVSARFGIHLTGKTIVVRVSSVKENGTAILTLFDAKGRTVGRWHLTKRVTQIDCTALPRGIYLGQITNGADRFVRKMLW